MRDLALMSLSRLPATAMASPMAVRSPAMPTSSLSTRLSSSPLSRVSGHWVNASSPKITSPIRSRSRLTMKSFTTFLTAVRRSTASPSILKSIARIVPEVSRQSTMSTPEVLVSRETL